MLILTAALDGSDHMEDNASKKRLQETHGRGEDCTPKQIAAKR